jgi:Ni/Co efflux regulator RcnB
MLTWAGAASSQTDQTTTTVTQSPSTTTETTETKSQDATGDYTQYRKTVTSTHKFDAGPWNAPAGVAYRRFVPGDHVPSQFLADNVILTNYQNYELVAPPDGTAWVRVGRDALLVRTDNGEIIQADYGRFD